MGEIFSFKQLHKDDQQCNIQSDLYVKNTVYQEIRITLTSHSLDEVFSKTAKFISIFKPQSNIFS